MAVPVSKSSRARDMPSIRLGVWAGDGNNVHFLAPILEALPGHIQAKVFTWDPEIPEHLLRHQLGNVDVAWLEWGSATAVAMSRLTSDIPTICRIHRYEVYSPFPREIQWRHIECAVFISEYIKECYVDLHGELPGTRMEVVPNAIPVGDYPFDESRGRNFNIGFLGRLHYVKNPLMLVQILKRVLEKDDRYQLHIAGAVQQMEISQYLVYQAEQMGISDHIHFYGHLDKSDVRSLLAQCSTLLSTSVIEGHPLGIMEGMASGCKPVIHDFPGARALFDGEFLFNTIDEAADLVLSASFEPRRYRAFISRNFEQSRQVARIVELIEDLAKTGRNQMSLAKAG